MLTNPKAKAKLLSYLRAKSILHGYFVLLSGVRSTYYVDCKSTNLDPDDAGLVGHHLNANTEARNNRKRWSHDSDSENIAGEPASCRGCLFRGREESILQSSARG